MSDLSKDQIEGVECPHCGAARGCSCIVPNPECADVCNVDGRHFHRLRVTRASVHVIADADVAAAVADQLRLHDRSLLVEERVANHFVARMRSGKAPPTFYRVGVQMFDGIVARTCAMIQFGDRDHDGRRSEHVVVHTSHGLTRVFMARDVEDDEVRTTECGAP